MTKEPKLNPGDEIKVWVYAILVHGVGADPSPSALGAFMMHWDPYDPPSYPQEWRFCGKLGFGGKFYSTSRNWWTNCYPEDRTSERVHAIYETNQRLEALKRAFDEMKQPEGAQD
jgi:hypothetical protein